MNDLHSKKAHFFLTSAATWLTTSAEQSLHKCMKKLDREGYRYAIWCVPLPPDSDYEIVEYRPQVQGAVWVETIDPKPRTYHAKDSK
jgi:hypothetical protein